ncbi:hypothetical protein Pelo_18160 [Pelomyxa schiedti]|nr:hypothetical protein Pelo_18160 [Pelomyxa schiedti]
MDDNDCDGVVVIGTEFETDARAQFIALGVGVIVGRCGGSGPVSALTPSSLSILGRDWIVFPARILVAHLSRDQADKYVKISVSPTLGLVGHPTIVSFGRHQVSSFFHWVGPPSCGDRFAFVIAQATDGHPGRRNLCVIDTRRGGRDHASSIGDEDVKPILRLNLCRLWCSNRRWFAGLVLAQLEAGILVIDLEATFAQHSLVSTPLSLPALDVVESVLIDNVVFWEGMDHALLSDKQLLCLSTGQRRPIRPGTTGAIGGPYAAVYVYRERDYTEIEVYNVFEPTKVCCTHRAQRGRQRMRIGQETVLLGDDFTIRVIDAVSGLLLCKMFPNGFSVTGVSQHNNNWVSLL